MAPLHRLGRFLLFLSFATNALAQDDTSGDDYAVITIAESDLPSWATENTLQLELSTDSANYAIIPLTENLGLGGSAVERGVSFHALESLISKEWAVDWFERASIYRASSKPRDLPTTN